MSERLSERERESVSEWIGGRGERERENECMRVYFFFFFLFEVRNGWW